MFTYLEFSYPTEVFNSKAIEPTQDGSVSPILVLIPGNPGNAGFYVDYLTALQKEMPQYEMLAISYAGFTEDHVGKVNFNEVVGLPEQARHKIEVIEKLVGDDPKRPIYLVGHSVGTYLVELMLTSLRAQGNPLLKQIKFVGLITPTLNNLELSRNGESFGKMFKWAPNFHIYCGMLAYAAKLLPGWFMDFYLRRKYKTESKNILGAFKQFIQSRNIITKCLGLAREELTTIKDDNSLNKELLEVLRENQIRLWAFFCHTDYWIHNSTRSDLVETFGAYENADVVIHDDVSIRHSFVIKSSSKFAAISAKAIQD